MGRRDRRMDESWMEEQFAAWLSMHGYVIGVDLANGDDMTSIGSWADED